MKKQTKIQQCVEAINTFGGATLTTDPFEKVTLLILRNGRIADHIPLTKKQAGKLTVFSYEKESVGMGRVKYFFKPA